jgi:hypothetical protein
MYVTATATDVSCPHAAPIINPYGKTDSGLVTHTNNPFEIYLLFIILSGSAAQRGLWPPRFTRFLDHTQRHGTVGRTPLDK